MATPLTPLPEPRANLRQQTPDGAMTTEWQLYLRAIVKRLNDVEARLAALEP